MRFKLLAFLIFAIVPASSFSSNNKESSLIDGDYAMHKRVL